MATLFASFAYRRGGGACSGIIGKLHVAPRRYRKVRLIDDAL
jgi:hypothetical protein